MFLNRQCQLHILNVALTFVTAGSIYINLTKIFLNLFNSDMQWLQNEGKV